MRIRKLVVP
jgi:hypothetical protein